MLLKQRQTVFREQHTGGASGGTMQGGPQTGAKEHTSKLLEEWRAIRERCEKLPNWNELKPEFDRFDGGLNNFISRFGGSV